VGREDLESRIDPYYYQPAFQQAITILKTGKYPFSTVGKLCKEMVHPAEFPRKYSNEQEGLPFVRAGDVRDGCLNLVDLPFVFKNTLRSFPQSRLRVGDVLVVRTGARAGEVAMFAEPEGEYYASSHTLLLRVKASVNPRYLEQFLVSRLGKEQILRRLTGAAQKQLQKPTVASIRIPLPPRLVQDAIADKMDTAYERKWELEAEAAPLLASVDGYVLDQVGHGWGADPQAGKENVSPAVFTVWRQDVSRLDPKRYRWQSEIEDTGELRHLGELLIPRRDKVNRDEYEFEDLQLITLHFDGTIEPRDVPSWRTDIKGTLYFAHPGDLVYSKIDARNGAIGLVPDELGKVAVTSEYPVYQVKEDIISPAYLKMILRSSRFTALLKALASGHSGRKRIYPDTVEDIYIPVPTIEKQREIAEEVQRRRERATTLQDEAERVVAEAKAEVERMILGEEER
jgi:restriction endonuclease S subunit